MNKQQFDLSTEIIESNGVTAVRLKADIGGKTFFANGTARRDPVDRNDPEIAYGLAYGRALRQLGRVTLHNAQDKVRRVQRQPAPVTPSGDNRISISKDDLDRLMGFSLAWGSEDAFALCKKLSSE